jgi:hypothetical protein
MLGVMYLQIITITCSLKFRQLLKLLAKLPVTDSVKLCLLTAIFSGFWSCCSKGMVHWF